VEVASTARQLSTLFTLALMVTSPTFLDVQRVFAQDVKPHKRLHHVSHASGEHKTAVIGGVTLPGVCGPLSLCFPFDGKFILLSERESLSIGLRARFDSKDFPYISVYNPDLTKQSDLDDRKMRIDVKSKWQLSPLETKLLTFRLKLIASNIIHTKVDQIDVTVLPPSCFRDQSSRRSYVL
jgi:hypothetical protein